MLEECVIAERKRRLQNQRWMTNGQLIDRHHDCEIDAPTVEVKQSSASTWWLHPEVPHLQKARQYLCQVSEECIDIANDIVRKGFSLQIEMLKAKQSAKMLVQRDFKKTQAAIQNVGGHATSSCQAMQLPRIDAGPKMQTSVAEGVKGPAGESSKSVKSKGMMDLSPETKKKMEVGAAALERRGSQSKARGSQAGSEGEEKQSQAATSKFD